MEDLKLANKRLEFQISLGLVQLQICLWLRLESFIVVIFKWEVELDTISNSFVMSRDKLRLYHL